MEIPRATKPTIVLWAASDLGHGTSDPEALLEYAPHARWIELPDTGHHLDLERPDVLAEIIRGFVD